MNYTSSRNYLFAITTLAGLAAAAHAQGARGTPPTPPNPPTPAGQYHAYTTYVGDPFVYSVQGNDPTLQKKIKLDLKDKKAADIFKKIADEAGVELIVDPGATSDRKYSLKAEEFTVQSYLNSMANFESVRWRLQSTNGKKQIRISRAPTSAFSVFTPGQATKVESKIHMRQAEIDKLVQDRMALATTYVYGNGAYRLVSRASLPDTRVKIDMRDADVRDILKDILTQANLPYALEDDVPTGQKRSFTFENVPIRMALDIITASIGVGWSSESQRTTTTSGTGSVPAAPLVRVGKKYTMGLGALNGLRPASSISITTTTSEEKDDKSVPTTPSPVTPASPPATTP